MKPEQATAILVALRTGPWTEEHLGALSQSISACIAATTTTKAGPPPTQNFMAIESYCTTDLLNTFRDKDTSLRLKVVHLTGLLASLGVHAPSEKSVQRCVAFLLLLHLGVESAVAMDSTQKLCLALDLKSTLKAAVAKAPVEQRLVDYPASPSEFQTLKPAEFASRYCSQGPVDADISATELMVVAQSVPMRKTHKAVKDKEPPTLNLGRSSVDQAGPVAMAMMQQMHAVQCKTLEMLSMMAGQHPAQTTFSPASSSSLAWSHSPGCSSQMQTPRRSPMALGYLHDAAQVSEVGGHKLAEAAHPPPAHPTAAHPSPEHPVAAHFSPEHPGAAHLSPEDPVETDVEAMGDCPEGREALPSSRYVTIQCLASGAYACCMQWAWAWANDELQTLTALYMNCWFAFRACSHESHHGWLCT